MRFQPLLQVFAFHSGDRLSRLTFVVSFIPNSNHLLQNFRERNMEVGLEYDTPSTVQNRAVLVTDQLNAQILVL